VSTLVLKNVDCCLVGFSDMVKPLPTCPVVALVLQESPPRNVCLRLSLSQYHCKSNSKCLIIPRRHLNAGEVEFS